MPSCKRIRNVVQDIVLKNYHSTNKLIIDSSYYAPDFMILYGVPCFIQEAISTLSHIN